MNDDTLIRAIVITMKAALAFATLRDQLVGEGGHTSDSARDFLAVKFNRPGAPSAADLIDWWDAGCDYTSPAFSHILESSDIPAQAIASIVERAAEPDGVLARMQGAARNTKEALQ